MHKKIAKNAKHCAKKCKKIARKPLFSPSPLLSLSLHADQEAPVRRSEERPSFKSVANAIRTGIFIERIYRLGKIKRRKPIVFERNLDKLAEKKPAIKKVFFPGFERILDELSKAGFQNKTLILSFFFIRIIAKVEKSGMRLGGNPDVAVNMARKNCPVPSKIVFHFRRNMLKYFFVSFFSKANVELPVDDRPA